MEYLCFWTDKGDFYGAGRLGYFETEFVVVSYYGGGHLAATDITNMPSGQAVELVTEWLTDLMNDIGANIKFVSNMLGKLK